jgi:hypothetical protein
MFWLFHAVLFGIPAGVFMMTSFLSMVLSVAKRKDLDANLHPYRTAFLIAMAGYFLVGWTVHFWNGTYVLFLFLLGSGGWLVDIDKGKRPMTRRLPGTHVEGSLVLSDDVGQSPDNDRQQGSLTWKGARPDRSNGARRRERSSIDSGLTGLQPGDPEAVGSRDISSALQQRRSWSAVRDRSRHLWRH